MLHPVEIQNALDGAVVLIDNREQPTPRLQARIKQIGLPIERVTLSFGDYSIKCPLPDGSWFNLSNVCVVERKMGAEELAMCFGRERDRFEREFERAKEAGARMYLLVEDATLEMLYGGRYRSKMKPKALIASLFAFTARYDCKPIFCREQTGGLVIRDVLIREAKERLTDME